MRVLITLKSTIRKDSLGGVGMYYLSLQNHFHPLVEYFHFSDDKSKNLLKKVKFRITDMYTFFRKCRKKQPKIDIVHLNPSLSWSGLLRDGFFLMLARLYKKKTIVFFRGWHEYMVTKIDQNRIIRFFFKKVYGKSDAFIALSSAFKTKLREWDFKQPVFIETTSVDDRLIAASEGSQQQKKTKNKISILFLARVEKAKGIYETLEAYRLLAEKQLDISLTIAGDGSCLYEIKQFASDNNLDVKFKGYVSGEEKGKTFAESDIYLFPTYHGEGMPNAVLEAMAFGLPVITRPVGGLNDFFEDGKMGYLTESKDPKVYAELIEKLITNPVLRKEISAYNAAFARNHFMASNVARRLENIYQEVLEGKAKDASWMDNIRPF
jgi:glycosyltransferase involved in cell wall biosynthesis